MPSSSETGHAPGTKDKGHNPAWFTEPRLSSLEDCVQDAKRDGDDDGRTRARRKAAMRWRIAVLALGATFTALGMSSVALAAPEAAGAKVQRTAIGWVNAWQASPVPPGTIPGAPCPAATGLDNQTIRDIEFITAGGDRIRVRLSNTFGARPLQVGAASVAIAGTGAASVPGSTRPLRFSRRSAILIAAGADALSDPVSLKVKALQRLDVSVYLPSATGPATQHFFAQQDDYLANGDEVGASTPANFATQISCRLFVSGVDVDAAARRYAGSIVTLGDSITDGYGSTANANRRWPDDLARRLNRLRGRVLSVSNAGIGGNELLTFRTDQPFSAIFGWPAPARLPRDVLSQAGVQAVILLEGINDIGADAAKASDLIQVDQQIIAQAHAAGLHVYGATLTPFGGSNAQYGGQYGTAEGEMQRRLLNHWIRTSGAFDAIFDFDKAVRDPRDPSRMRAQYDSGDHLHPSDAGYKKMAQTVNLAVLLRGI